MAWLHTWAGLVFGWLLFAIFLTGTLSYFKDEITEWTQPEIVPHEVTAAVALERAQQWLQSNAPDAKRWFISLPDERNPDIGLSWSPVKGGFERKSLDSLSGQPVQARESMGGEFFYRFHFQLQMPYPWGRWLASLAAMVMFVALISGIITHKKIFKEFFTFRPRKGQRTWLDGHNAVAVLVLPFHLMITYSSLVIFMTMIMPASILTTYGGNTGAFFDDLFPAFKTATPSTDTAPLTSLAPMLEVVADTWDGNRAGLITVNNPGKANATVSIGRNDADTIAREAGTTLTFDGVTGDLTQSTSMTSASLILAGGLYGLHMGHFAGPLLRWLFFLAGIGGTAMIATGLVIWLGKRRLKHAKTGVLPFELKLVEMLNVASMAGLMLAVVSFFWANRLLPVSVAGRSDWEVQTFFYVWGAALLHAFVRVFFCNGRTAWREQLTLAAALYCLLPVVDMATAGRYLWASLEHGHWTLAALDLTALATGVFLGWGALRFRGDGQAVIASKLSPAGQRFEKNSAQSGRGELARKSVSSDATAQEAH